MLYEKQTGLILGLRGCGLGIRDVANALGEPPGTVSGRLNGYLPLTPENRIAILKLIAEARAKLSALYA